VRAPQELCRPNRLRQLVEASSKNPKELYYTALESETAIVTEKNSKVVYETPEEERERLRFVHGGSLFQPGAGMAVAKGFLAAIAVIAIFLGCAYLANLILQ